MPRYISMGEVPRKRHTQFRKPDGSLYSEQVFGTKGFSGISSILYHAHPPTQVEGFQSLPYARAAVLSDEPLRHRHLKTHSLPPHGDPISGRVPLLSNADVAISVCVPEEPMGYLYKDADGDNLVFVHEGQGQLETMFGSLRYRPGDYLVIPRGMIYRIIADKGSSRFLVIESASAIETPHRYRNEYGQLLEHSPYCERDIRAPEHLDPQNQPGNNEVRIKARGRLTSYAYNYYPLDVVGWDGFLYPWALNIADFEPITGSLHQPPPVHQTFEAQHFVVCSFVPRMLDYHPQAVPVPYNHSNLDSDELLYYVNGNFASRRGIEVGSMTLHPSGLPHGPQPGTVEASIGHTRTEELAVMVDTFRPLYLMEPSQALDDPNYPSSWKSQSA